MKLKFWVTYVFPCLFILLSCSKNSIEEINEEPTEIDTGPTEVDQNPFTTYNILALGDSYTIGQSVCETCRFPEQLKTSILNNTENKQIDLKIIATTGWTTTNLINAIDDSNLNNEYDLVTLLIGVNNQYQGKPFSIFETEFPELLETASTLAKGDKNNVIVISIPDYAYTPFGNGNESISNDIDKYNTFIENYCSSQNITYIYITDITRMGLENPELVASDGLHPSKLAYSKFVERILPIALEKLN